MNSKKLTHIRIGIDIGGTFTDFVILDPSTGFIHTFKLPSTPDDPAKVVLAGLKKIDHDLKTIENFSSKNWEATSSERIIIHGSTVATNALLEQKGVKTALITTKGFKDILQIGRQNRLDLYNFSTNPPEPIVPEDLRFEIDERVNSLGEVVKTISESEIDDLIHRFNKRDVSNKIESIAVVYLFSFIKPDHEMLTAKKLREAGFFVSASHEVLPEFREYERTSTTVINAYVSPILDQYLEKLEISLTPQNTKPSRSNLRSSKSTKKAPSTKIQIMQSNGGCISVREAKVNGVRCVLSGPAGGVVGSKFIGQMALKPSMALKIITFDMGGTSTDVSLIEGDVKITSESRVGGYPISIPMLDIHTIGAGGGSIAYKDIGGVMRVGPESAGADPGPACYGNQISKLGSGSSSLPTVTDANVVLGRIHPDEFLGGEIKLFPELAIRSLESLGNQLGLDLYQTALGMIEIANTHMERAIRVISVERGYDPREYTLLSFGGAGGLHAADLARRLNIPKVLIPPFAATFSAFGMVTADVIKDYTQTVMLPGSTSDSFLRSKFDPLINKGIQQIKSEGFEEDEVFIEKMLDVRYRGQSFELTIPYQGNPEDKNEITQRFGQTHLKIYGYDRPGIDIEIVNLRVRATGFVSTPRLKRMELVDSNPIDSLIDFREVFLEHGKQGIPCYRGESLLPGNKIKGPAMVIRKDTTILFGESDTALVDQWGNLDINIGKQAKYQEEIL